MAVEVQEVDGSHATTEPNEEIARGVRQFRGFRPVRRRLLKRDVDVSLSQNLPAHIAAA